MKESRSSIILPQRKAGRSILVCAERAVASIYVCCTISGVTRVSLADRVVSSSSSTLENVIVSVDTYMTYQQAGTAPKGMLGRAWSLLEYLP